MDSGSGMGLGSGMQKELQPDSLSVVLESKVAETVSLETVVLMRGKQLFFRTEAVVMALSRARGFRILRRLMWLPWRWLDPLYRVVAANRHRIPWLTRSQMNGNSVSESSAAPAVCYVEMPERMLP
jgi:Uncharacterized protein conserved in bacteria